MMVLAYDSGGLNQEDSKFKASPSYRTNVQRPAYIT